MRTTHRTKAAGRARVPQAGATAPNHRWSMDFMSARGADGRWFRILTVVDPFTRECLCLVADQSLSGEKVAQALAPVVLQRGAPRSITVDNGSKFASRSMDAWASQHGIQLDFIRPGNPVETGFLESFNGRLRDECLTVEVFFTLEAVREKLARWQEDYNPVRPHRSLQDQAPASFAADCSATARRAPASHELLETLTGALVRSQRLISGFTRSRCGNILRFQPVYIRGAGHGSVKERERWPNNWGLVTSIPT